MEFSNKPFEKNLDAEHYLYFLLIELLVKHPEKKIVILLDSLDQLNTSDYNTEW
jgi:hypothetical protein